MGFQRAIDYQPPTWPEPAIPQQSHLDFSVPDLDEGEEFARSLGATLATIQSNPERWRVMIDSAGHPFCLSAARAE